MSNEPEVTEEVDEEGEDGVNTGRGVWEISGHDPATGIGVPVIEEVEVVEDDDGEADDDVV